MTNVLIAIDSSSQAEAAFDWYLQHLHRHGNSVCVLHSVDLSAVSMADDTCTSEAHFTQMWHQQKLKIKALEDKYRWKMNEIGIAGKTRSESGKPGEVIIRVAKEEKAGLVVIGSRGLSKLKRTLGASVSDYVLHNSACPVVICRKLAGDGGDTDSLLDEKDSRRGSTASQSSIGSASDLINRGGSFKLNPAPNPPSKEMPKIMLERDLEELSIEDDDDED